MARSSELPFPWSALASRLVDPANYFGVTYSTFYRWAHHMSVPSPSHAEALAHAFAHAGLPLPAFGKRGVQDYHKEHHGNDT